MKIGISGYERDLDGKIDFFELDLSDRGSNPPKRSGVIYSLNQFFYRHPNPIPLSERIEMIDAKASNAQTLAFSIRLTPRFFESHQLDRDVLPLLRALVYEFGLPVYIDLPQTAADLCKMEPTFSTDPLWTKPRQGGLWKIHGWHKVRWVRRYSKQQLEQLKKLTSRYQPHFLIFGHSQRAQQIQEFLNLSPSRAGKS